MGSVAHQPRPTGTRVDGILVRRPTTDGWLETLPPSPQAAEVTVSLTDPNAALRHAVDLTAQGYRPVGAAGSGSGADGWADFLVPRDLALADEVWLRALLGPAGRLYEPSLGPVRALLATVLAAH